MRECIERERDTYEEAKNYKQLSKTKWKINGKKHKELITGNELRKAQDFSVYCSSFLKPFSFDWIVAFCVCVPTVVQSNHCMPVVSAFKTRIIYKTAPLRLTKTISAKRSRNSNSSWTTCGTQPIMTHISDCVSLIRGTETPYKTQCNSSPLRVSRTVIISVLSCGNGFHLSLIARTPPSIYRCENKSEFVF